MLLLLLLLLLLLMLLLFVLFYFYFFYYCYYYCTLYSYTTAIPANGTYSYTVRHMQYDRLSQQQLCFLLLQIY